MGRKYAHRMTQLPDSEANVPESGLHLLYVDGSKRPSPAGESTGEASIGVVVMDPKGREVLGRLSKKIGTVPDPHQAEYVALLEGLKLARGMEPAIEYLAIMSDSRTVVNQVNHLWEARAHLGILRDQVLAALSEFPPGGVQVSWIPREWNKAHDETAKAFRSDS